MAALQIAIACSEPGCGGSAVWTCDWRAGTQPCGAPLCLYHRWTVSGVWHLCPTHAARKKALGMTSQLEAPLVKPSPARSHA